MSSTFLIIALAAAAVAGLLLAANRGRAEKRGETFLMRTPLVGRAGAWVILAAAAAVYVVQIARGVSPADEPLVTFTAILLVSGAVAVWTMYCMWIRLAPQYVEFRFPWSSVRRISASSVSDFEDTPGRFVLLLHGGEKVELPAFVVGRKELALAVRAFVDDRSSDASS